MIVKKGLLADEPTTDDRLRDSPLPEVQLGDIGGDEQRHKKRKDAGMLAMFCPLCIRVGSSAIVGFLDRLGAACDEVFRKSIVGGWVCVT